MAIPNPTLCLNCGSSSVKYAVFDGDLHKLASGLIEARDAKAVHEALAAVAGFDISAVGHRVVHGGPNFSEPVVITQEVRNHIAAIASWAPEHQPIQVEAIDIAMRALPNVKHVACFDTAFHRTIPPERQHMALPADYARRGLLRYGFHGLSCSAIAQTFPAEKLIVCHLGNGCSVTAIDHGRSVHTSMGFTPVDGVMMGTRSGSVDPGAVLWLVDELGGTDKVRTLINKQSGLLGVSGLSSDMRALLASEDPRAAFAITMFIDRIVLEIGRAAAALQGLDRLVFTGGIGENAEPIRASITKALAWLNLEFSTSVVKADEERVIAKAVLI
jgi:acetate kinase